jgi:hypothetical protein
MAKIQGVFTGWKGKVGNVVYAMWKGIQVAKTRVIPYNPQSAAQTVQRSLFATLVSIGRGILTDIIQVFWDPFVGSQTSGWAEWLSKNLLLLSGSAIDYSGMVFSLGSLYATDVVSGVYTTGTGVCVISFDTSAVNNQSVDDKAYAIVFDSSDGKFYYNTAGTVKRSDGSLTVSCPTGLAATNLECYLWFAQGNLSAGGIVSDSQHKTGQAA